MDENVHTVELNDAEILAVAGLLVVGYVTVVPNQANITREMLREGTSALQSLMASSQRSAIVALIDRFVQAARQVADAHKED